MLPASQSQLRAWDGAWGTPTLPNRRPIRMVPCLVPSSNTQVLQGLSLPSLEPRVMTPVSKDGCHPAKNDWAQRAGRIGPTPPFIILIRNSPRGGVICPKSCDFLELYTNRKISTFLSFPLLSGYLGASGSAFEKERRGRPRGPGFSNGLWQGLREWG